MSLEPKAPYAIVECVASPQVMPNPLELSLSQSFEKERFGRAIEESTDLKEVKEIARVLLNGWFSQRAATQWVLKEALGARAKIGPDDLKQFGFHPHT